jgi:predicted nucleic acid-binding protein
VIVFDASAAVLALVNDGDARAALGRWARLGLRRYAAVGLLSRIWELRDNLSAFDATYVALAERAVATSSPPMRGSPGRRVRSAPSRLSAGSRQRASMTAG